VSARPRRQYLDQWLWFVAAIPFAFQPANVRDKAENRPGRTGGGLAAELASSRVLLNQPDSDLHAVPFRFLALPNDGVHHAVLHSHVIRLVPGQILLAADQGLNAPEQKALMIADPPPATRHPYFWAGFVLLSQSAGTTKEPLN